MHRVVLVRNDHVTLQGHFTRDFANGDRVITISGEGTFNRVPVEIRGDFNERYPHVQRTDNTWEQYKRSPSDGARHKAVEAFQAANSIVAAMDAATIDHLCDSGVRSDAASRLGWYSVSTGSLATLLAKIAGELATERHLNDVAAGRATVSTPLPDVTTDDLRAVVEPLLGWAVAPDGQRWWAANEPIIANNETDAGMIATAMGASPQEVHLDRSRTGR